MYSTQSRGHQSTSSILAPYISSSRSWSHKDNAWDYLVGSKLRSGNASSTYTRPSSGSGGKNSGLNPRFKRAVSASSADAGASSSRNANAMWAGRPPSASSLSASSGALTSFGLARSRRSASAGSDIDAAAGRGAVRPSSPGDRARVSRKPSASGTEAHGVYRSKDPACPLIDSNNR